MIVFDLYQKKMIYLRQKLLILLDMNYLIQVEQ